MEFLLKQRLVGAVVLVALGVIFIPMLLEGPEDTLVPEMEALPELVDPGPGRPLDAFPSVDRVPDGPETSVLAADVLPEPEPEVVTEPAPSPRAEPAADVQPEPAPAPEAEPVPESKATVAADQSQAALKPVPGEPKAGPLGSWVVQVGSFSDQQKAVALRDKVRQVGFATQVEKVRVQGKTYYRVRVGPFLERSEAEQSQNQLADKLKLSGRVLSYP